MCNCCFGSTEGESCGWPRGTVRACVALTTIPLGFLASTIIMVILIIKEQYTIALGVNGVIWGVIGTIIGHYFGAKQSEGAAKMISQAEHELIESRNMEIARKDIGSMVAIPNSSTNTVIGTPLMENSTNRRVPRGYSPIPLVRNDRANLPKSHNPSDVVINMEDNDNNVDVIISGP